MDFQQIILFRKRRKKVKRRRVFPTLRKLILYTANCRKCMLIRAGIKDFGPLDHTAECRRRVIEEMRTKGNAKQRAPGCG